jgi:Raf kinase inhibitor-like YbhB/YbcL family protein
MKHDPYDQTPPAPAFRVTSTDVIDGKALPRRNASRGVGGSNTSPQLSWYGFPEQTQSFLVTMYDADAPTPSGFWHWLVKDVPASVTELKQGAGTAGDDGLPAGARHHPNDARDRAYDGPAPPQGSGPHRYFIAVHALDVASLDVDDDATPAYLNLQVLGHTLARAVMVPWYENVPMTAAEPESNAA